MSAFTCEWWCKQANPHVDLPDKYRGCHAVENTHHGLPVLDLGIVIAGFPPPEARAERVVVPLQKRATHNAFKVRIRSGTTETMIKARDAARCRFGSQTKDPLSARAPCSQCQR
jgi:hypothetical protein